jgi:hypothetical protein
VFLASQSEGSLPLPTLDPNVAQMLAALFTGNWRGLLDSTLAATSQGLWSMVPDPMIMDAGDPRNNAQQTIGTPMNSSQCSIYSQGTSGKILNYICRKTPDTPWAQIMRGCLQALYDPNLGYIPLPTLVQIGPANFFDINSILPGTGAHVVCALEAGQ